MARKIMDEILFQENLSCSVWVGPNKIVAKIASDFRKPFGLTVVEEKDVLGFLYPLKAGKLPGVGPKTERGLLELKIERNFTRSSNGLHESSASSKTRSWKSRSDSSRFR